MQSSFILGLTKRILVVDVESSSPVDLKKRGQYQYWHHPDSRVLMTGIKWLGGERAQVFDHEADNARLPLEVKHAITAPKEEVMLAAANCKFDQDALARMGYPTPDDKWLDILVLAYILGFSGRLDDVLKQTPLNVQKNARGSHCISLFSVRQANWFDYPEEWGEFLGYCANDAEVEEKLLRWCLFWLDQDWMRPSVQRIIYQELVYRRANQRGLPVDSAAVRGALKIRDTETERLMRDMRNITALDNPNSVSQLLDWCQMHGSMLQDLQKANVRDEVARLDSLAKVMEEEGDLLRKEQVERLASVLRMRGELGKTSVKKFDALDNSTCPWDDRLRGGWQFYGASRTGRVAGRILNPANLARPGLEHPEMAAELLEFGDWELMRACFPNMATMDVLSSTIRGCMAAPDGMMWCVGDWTSIESVGAAWLAGCDDVLDIFFAGRDTYKTLAVEFEGVPYEEITKEQRTFAKPAMLGGFYMLSGAGLVAYAASMGVTLELDLANYQIAKLRARWHEVAHMWRQLMESAKAAIRNPGERYYAYAVDKIANEYEGRNGKTYYDYYYKPWPRTTYWYDGTFLFCELPSGRHLCYYEPSVERQTIHMADGHSFDTDALCYYGIDQKATSNRWTQVSTHGGGLLENNTQALCRDVAWEALEKIDLDPGLDMVGDVYDEPLSLCDERDTTALDRMLGYMRERPTWADDRFFLGADGYIAKRYKKD